MLALLNGFELLLLLGVAFWIFWIWMLVDCIRNERLDTTQKTVWAVVIALTHVLGALIYFVFGRRRGPGAAKAQSGNHPS